MTGTVSKAITRADASRSIGGESRRTSASSPLSSLLTWLVVTLSAFSFLLSPVAVAQETHEAQAAPGDAAAVNPDEGKRYGVILRVSGEVLVKRPHDKSDHALRADDVVFVGDRIRATASGEALLRTDDAGLIGVRSNTEFQAEKYAAAALDSDRMSLRLLRGSLRIITGWIGRSHRENYTVVTPTASIGIRGTDHEPYVLPSDLSGATPYKAGSYDKVNTGRTVITTTTGEVEVDPGHVGFARQVGATEPKTRGLMSLLLPVLLERIPDFYVAGKFERDLDEFSKTAEATTARELDAKKQQVSSKDADTSPKAEVATCSPGKIAKDWIRRFDRAVERGRTGPIVALFASDAAIQANARDGNGALVTINLDRKEFAKSAADSVAQRSDYHQNRTTLDAGLLSDSGSARCERISVESNVVEEGKLAGKPYRIESKEEYVLELRDGHWLAVRATTTQR